MMTFLFQKPAFNMQKRLKYAWNKLGVMMKSQGMYRMCSFTTNVDI